MLDAVSTGLHPSAVVGQLAGKYGVSERCLWRMLVALDLKTQQSM